MYLEEQLLLSFTTLNILDDDLAPYTEYAYSLLAKNAAGSGSSEYTEGRTLPTMPKGLLPPTAKADGPDIILLTWVPPSKPNGQYHHRKLG